MFSTSVSVCYQTPLSISADNRRNREWVTESVGILEGNSMAINKRLPIIDETIVKMKALENARVNKACRAKPATAEMDAGDVTARDTDVHNLHCVRGYPTG